MSDEQTLRREPPEPNAEERPARARLLHARPVAVHIFGADHAGDPDIWSAMGACIASHFADWEIQSRNLAISSLTTPKHVGPGIGKLAPDQDNLPTDKDPQQQRHSATQGPIG